jgi:SAM-dependent methyltransferase
MRASDYITGDPFRLERTAAGWWVTVPQPADAARYYPRQYYGNGGRRFPALVEWLQQRLYRGRARRVTRLAGRAGRVLDVGCGPGHLLAEFKSLGWEVLGTEATEHAATIARGRHGVQVRVGDLRELALPAAHFDAVVSWHTLEHMARPDDVLDEIARLLKPGGVLLVSVPDFGSPEAQQDPAAWFHLDVPRHLCHIPAPVLRAALRQRGFRVESERYCTPEYDTFSIVQTWQNRMGLPYNLLYLILRRIAVPKATLTQRAAAVGLGAVLLPVAQAIAAWRSLRRSGAVVVFLARKTTSERLPAQRG